MLARPGLQPLAAALRPGQACLAVPDPNASVLAGFGELLRKVPIELNELA